MKQHIPNALTLLNLFCGCIAVIAAVNDAFVPAAFFVFLGIFFDFFDGFAARKLNVQSALGLELDSLADMVTSGLVPGIVMFKLISISSGIGIEHSWSSGGENIDVLGYIKLVTFKDSLLPLLGLCITLASAYRLAKFNIDTEQQTFFKGLPTPANALLILSLPLIVEFQNNDSINALILNTWFLIGLTIFSCWLLNAKLKLFALKFKTFSFRPNATRYTFVVLCLILLIVLNFTAIPLIIILYLLMSVLDHFITK